MIQLSIQNWGALQRVDKSEVELSDSLGQKIYATVDKEVFEPNRRIMLKDLYTGKLITTKINNIVTLGNSKTGIEKYKLIAINDKDKSLTFQDDNSKLYTVKTSTDYKKPSND